MFKVLQIEKFDQIQWITIEQIFGFSSFEKKTYFLICSYLLVHFWCRFGALLLSLAWFIAINTWRYENDFDHNNKVSVDVQINVDVCIFIYLYAYLS